MKSKGVRLYGAYDIRLEEFDLPEIRDDEILVRVMSDSICMSTYKLLMQGKAHKRCPQDVETRPVLIGHEFAGDIVKVGRKWRNEFCPGEKFAQQPALNYKGSLASPRLFLSILRRGVHLLRRPAGGDGTGVSAPL